MKSQHDWTFTTIKGLFELSLVDLLYQAQSTHRKNFDPNNMQVSSLLSVKTGRCKEDCAYCPQSAHYATGLNKESFLSLEDVTAAAKKAKALGASSFCVSASGSSLSAEDFQKFLTMIKEVKKVGLNACATFGELSVEQVKQLEEAGLNFYNHNIDTSPEFYPNIITTRKFTDRLRTLNHLANSTIKICCGVIIGMGESIDDRINMLLALMPTNPDVIPINRLIKCLQLPEFYFQKLLLHWLRAEMK
jgi:biotin synthase